MLRRINIVGRLVAATATAVLITSLYLSWSVDSQGGDFELLQGGSPRLVAQESNLQATKCSFPCYVEGPDKL